jgi:hypothetical protein
MTPKCVSWSPCGLLLLKNSLHTAERSRGEGCEPVHYAREPIDVDDPTLVHVGYAVQKVSSEEAKATWDVFDEAVLAQGR